MWLYPEVLPRRPKVRLWMFAPAAVLAIAVGAVIAVPQDDSAIAQDTVIQANLGRIQTARAAAELHVRIAMIDYVLSNIQTGASCTSDCADEHEQVIRHRARLSAVLKALRARVSLTPQPATGIPLPPACLEHPQAMGCK